MKRLKTKGVDHPSSLLHANRDRQIATVLSAGIAGDVGQIGDIDLMPSVPSLLKGLSCTKRVALVPSGATPSTALSRLKSLSGTCQECGSLDLRDDSFGIRCGACKCLCWVVGENSITRVDHADWLFAGEDMASIPTCGRCERFCDTETADGQWHCSECDSNATQRFIKTKRVLSIVLKQQNMQ